MTTINQAQKLMDQRRIMIAEATEILAILGATQEEMQHKEQVINITINKGQIVAVETTKEIVKEVSNEEELNRLEEVLLAKTIEFENSPKEEQEKPKIYTK
mgnify:CR=1 FL=1